TIGRPSRKRGFQSGHAVQSERYCKNGKGNIRSSVGDGNTRSIHATIAILATG
ncbi:unnamed protein product, partial [Ascophyllum nodosum]